MKQKGFETHLIAVTTDPKEAIVRAFLRAKEDGRWVSSDELARAHQQFNAVLKHYVPLVDRADVWDNTLKNPRDILAKERNSPVEILNDFLYNLINERSKQK